jgi:hypothetical protein
MVPHPNSLNSNSNRIPFCPGGGGPDLAEQFSALSTELPSSTEPITHYLPQIFPTIGRSLLIPDRSIINHIGSNYCLFFLLDSLLSTRRIPDSLSFALFEAHISNTRARNFRLNGLSRDDLPSFNVFIGQKLHVREENLLSFQGGYFSRIKSFN